ncbi:MAG: hypothetical protein AAF530_20135 [Pseudomonadota bacterium]
MKVTVRRLLDEPIIRPHMDERMGDNINGPALIRVPDWVPNALGRYYLYFSDHKGRYIRLAFADDLTGPWQIYSPGALDITQSLFPAEDPEPLAPEDRPPWAEKMLGGYLYAHIASPDVHVDEEQKVIRMYYHGLLWNGDQETRLAESPDGLTFTAKEPLLGPPYFRAFCYGAHVYVITWGGALWRAEDWVGPFEAGPTPFPFAVLGGIGEGFRHGEVFCRPEQNLLHVFYTRMGDCPERILHSQIDLRGDWFGWEAGESRLMLSPEMPWEGGDLPLERSVMGAAPGPVRQLRDPCVFQDEDGRTYMLYCGAGECGIGLAEVKGV